MRGIWVLYGSKCVLALDCCFVDLLKAWRQLHTEPFIYSEEPVKRASHQKQAQVRDWEILVELRVTMAVSAALLLAFRNEL